MSLLARSRVLPRPTRTLITAVQRLPYPARFQSTATSGNEPTIETLSPRWLSDLKARIGRCIHFGLSPEQSTAAGEILQELTTDWRALLAGSEGFLTGKDRMGLYRQEVVWGEMHGKTNTDESVFHSLNVVANVPKGHVNNVMYNRYAESARVNWVLHFAATDPEHQTEWRELMGPTGIGLILRSIRTDYKFPMKYPDRVTVLHKLKHKPRMDSDHFILDVVILSELHRRPAARCVEDIAVYDYRAAQKAAMKPFMVKKLEETYELQEEARQKYGNKVLGLVHKVQRLEQQTWDRPDAKEDLGSADP